MTSPNPATFQALSTQVGGHSGVQASEDGSLLVKPALPLELEFYQTLNAASGDDNPFSTLKDYMPKFFGTLKLQGQVGVDGSVNALEDGKESLVLENLSHTFTKPNILDIKLGTELYDEEASPEKRERMIKTARETTSFESGIRLTGFQVYSNETGLAVNTPKSYGKSIKVSDLPDGVRKFFPTTSDPSTGSGLPASVILPILKQIRAEIQEILTAFEKIELRMVGGSVLVIYEADITKAEEGVNTFLSGSTPPEEDSEDDENEETAIKKPTPPFKVKMIDFAHTRLVPGQGKDEGVVKGFNTVLGLLDARIDEIQKEL